MKTKLEKIETLIKVEAIINDEVTYNLWLTDFLAEITRPFFFIVLWSSSGTDKTQRRLRRDSYLIVERRCVE